MSSFKEFLRIRFEDQGGCHISAACHWAVTMAASGGHGRMWGHAYAVTPSGIYVPPESSIRKPEDLANVEVVVGYHTGSHFSTLQGLEKFLRRAHGYQPSRDTFPEVR